MSQQPIIPPNPNDSTYVGILSPEGMHAVVCCDVVDRGEHTSKMYGTTKRKISVHWMLAELIPAETWTDPDGKVLKVPEKIANKPYVISEWYTFSLNEKSNLRKMLNTWRGRPMTDTEAENFDLQNLVGVDGVLTIGHNKGGNDKWYDNVMSLTRMQEPFKPITVDPDYVRLADRPPREGQEQQSSDESMQPPVSSSPPDDFGNPDNDSDLPF